MAKTADYFGPTPYTGETSQAQALNDRHQPTTGDHQLKQYNFFWTPKQLEISPDHSHQELAGQLGLSDEYSGPMALGQIEVIHGKAHWSVHTNTSIAHLVKELKQRSKITGWEWGGVSDLDGKPIGDEEEFGSKKSYYYAYDPSIDHLYIAKSKDDLITQTGHTGYGLVEVEGKTAKVSSAYPPALEEWASDHGYKISLLAEPLEPHLTLYHGTTNKALDLAQQRGGLHAWHPKDVATHVANHYGLDPQELYNHPYFEFSRSAREGENKIYATTDPRIAASYAHARSEQLEDALSTAHRMSYPELYEQPVGGVTGQQTKEHREAFKNSYYAQNDVSPRLLRLNVPYSAVPDAQKMVDAGFEPSGNFTINAPVPLDWVSEDNSKLAVQGPHDNLLKNVEDLEQHDLYSPENREQSGHQYYYQDQDDEGRPEGPMRCKECNKVFPNWQGFIDHQNYEHNNLDPLEPSGKLPESQPHATPPARFVEQQDQMIMSNNRIEQLRNGKRIAFAQLEDNEIVDFYGPQDHIAQKLAQDYGKMLAAPIPFVFDIKNDKIHIGSPGARVTDIPGRFSPGGVVEGRYEPGGKIIIETTSSWPFTVRHMLDLWKAQYGYFLVKNVFMETEGKKQKLANFDVVRQQVSQDPASSRAAQALIAAGGQVHVVGGAVRDSLMGKSPKDIDLMVTGLDAGTVDQVLNTLPGKTKVTGNDFGVHRYNEGGSEVEIALPRRERSTGAGYKDFDIQADPYMPPEEDLSRRDFTANAMAYDLNSGQLLDPHGGAQDIQNGTLRAVHPEALAEDPLRVLRAITAASKHGLLPEPETQSYMQANAPSLAHLPQERLQMELDKIMAGQNPAQALRLAHETGVLPHVLPEVSQAMGYSQNNPHHEQDLGTHLLSVMDRAKQIKPEDPDFAMAGLLHDIGKPASHWTECRDCGSYYNGNQTPCVNCGSGNTSGHFYQKEPGIGQAHESVGALMAQRRLSQLKYPNDRIDRITHLVQNHMWPSFTSPKGARRFVNTVGDQHADDLIKFRMADQGGKVDPVSQSSIDQQQELVNQVRSQGQLAPLTINGNDLLALGVPQGPQMGQILNNLRQQVVDDPSLNNREELLGLAQGML